MRLAERGLGSGLVEKLLKWGGGKSSVGSLGSLKVKFVPKTESRTVAALPLKFACPEVYDANSGVAQSGVQVGSPEGQRVAVTIAIADRDHRTPEVVVILGIPAGDPGVGQRDVSSKAKSFASAGSDSRRDIAAFSAI